MSELVMQHKLDVYDELRRTLMHAYRMDETEAVKVLLPAATLAPTRLERVQEQARALVEQVRRERQRRGIDAFMYYYDLSSDEGVALMCLAEAMLRIPDRETVDDLIQEKISSGNWASHRGSSPSMFVNAATWGLMLTGRIYTHDKTTNNYLSSTLKSFAARAGEPVLRKAVREGMKILGEQFVRGRTIEEAIKKSVAEKTAYLYSYDMLGEAARTMEDAQRYYQAYENAIHTIGASQQHQDVYQNAGISVKLSALHPRYEFAKRDEVLPFLIERMRMLCQLARKYSIGLTIDAEEANRLSLSLDVLQALAEDAELADWQGLGLAVQAYQKRAFYLIDWLAELAKKNQKRIMLRLVKGAYWDSEIKDSQVNGYVNYPVFTRKVTTDVSYIACAKKIIDYGELFYPQFATHNAYSVAVVLELMRNHRDFEFQCLHGMGRSLYDAIIGADQSNVRCRVYAPVGKHQDLLPYLVRRLLENGANTSFVNRIVDEDLPVADLIADPVQKLAAFKSKPHPHIPLPENIYGKLRKNSMGMDLSDALVLNNLRDNMHGFVNHQWKTQAATVKKPDASQAIKILNPANQHEIVGTVYQADEQTVEAALIKAKQAFSQWSKISVKARRDYLLKIAELLEENRVELMALAVREAGKSLYDALNEVREATDFCRYYAEQGWHVLKTIGLPGPTGETNQLQMHGRGIIACISPWNFPLAIFVGQVTAALMAGNVVIAKPAEQTPLIAGRAVQIMHEAGIPEDVLQLLPGAGETVGQTLCASPEVAGVIFTGSTETARQINQTLAKRDGSIAPLIAETGGQNAMIVDSTALPEQVIVDVLSSAFGSAGQRCSALRVLFLQAEIADRIITMLKGAMAQITVGFPGLLKNDIGPVIDQAAKNRLEAHINFLEKNAQLIYQVPLSEEHKYGTFFAPCAYEIPSINILKREVFGPILHVVRYERRNLDEVIESINSTHYGLTLGVHSRLTSFAEYIQQHAKVGNCYVNRNMIGAVVGVQPFGGEGLSGTGPKAGGPHYLSRLCTERVLTINTAATGGNAALLALGEE